MLPFLKSDSAASAGPAISHFPPPRFRPLVGPISEVKLQCPEYRPGEGTSEAQKLGLRYEAKVQNMIVGEFPGYIAGPYLHFYDASVMRTLQPDGILFLDNHVVIVEIKFQHMPEAWWQLEKLYSPIVQRLWPDKRISLLEICRSYDPSMPFPAAVMQYPTLREAVSAPREEFGVVVWRK